MSQLDLTPCTGLQSLHFICSTFSPYMPSRRPSLSWVIILLSKVHSRALRTIEFSIRSSELGSLNLQGLELILSDTRFGGLEGVTFVLEPEAGLEEPESAMHCPADMLVKRQMPVLWTKGLLRFEMGRR